MIISKGKYNAYRIFQQLLTEFPYYIEIEFYPDYSEIDEWLERELKIECAIDYTRLLSEDATYVLFLFRNKEHATGVKLKWA